MTRQKQLKQAIEKAETKFYNEVKFKPQQSIQQSFLSGVNDTLSNPSILRHADPEIMKQAGWVREDYFHGIIQDLMFDPVINMYVLKEEKFLYYINKIAKT